VRPSRKSVPLISLKDFGSSPFLDHGIFVEAFEDCVSIRQKRMEVHRHDYIELFLLQGRGSVLIDFGTVNKLPIASGVPYHSIIGDRGKGDTPKSSDGVVPYWSSHLDGAQSELIVPSDHLALRNTEAIKEVERILRTYYQARLAFKRRLNPAVSCGFVAAPRTLALLPSGQPEKRNKRAMHNLLPGRAAPF
jgi:hypothetical protein